MCEVIVATLEVNVMYVVKAVTVGSKSIYTVTVVLEQENSAPDNVLIDVADCMVAVVHIEINC